MVRKLDVILHHYEVQSNKKMAMKFVYPDGLLQVCYIKPSFQIHIYISFWMQKLMWECTKKVVKEISL